MKKNWIIILSKFLLGVFITCLILLLVRFTYNKGKFESEMKSNDFQQEYPRIKRVKLGYYGLFNKNKKISNIYADFLKHKDEYDVIFFYYFDLGSSHKEIVIVLENQPKNLLTFPFGPPQLFLDPIGPTFKNKIPTGLYLIQEHYGFGLKECVSIKYWAGELKALLREYVENRLGVPNYRMSFPFLHESLLKHWIYTPEPIFINK